MPSSTISTKGQVTVPQAVRESLGVTVGDEVDFVNLPDGTWQIRPKTISVWDIVGCLPRPQIPTPSIAEMDAIAHRAAAEANR
jgi:AbrB family looped-hinge helix DNA binding protein